MVPRVTVSDDGDRITLVTALLSHVSRVAAYAVASGENVHETIDELSRTIGLIESLRDEHDTKRVEKVFGPVDADSIGDALNRLVQGDSENG